VIIQTDDDIRISRDDDESPESAPAAGEEPGEHKARPIVLGPRTRPPLPTSVQLVSVTGRAPRGGVGRAVIRLDRDIVGERLSDEAIERVRQAIERSEGWLDLDVYIPLRRSVEVSLLSSHIASLDHPDLRKLTLHVTGKLSED
jgi:hypothetical protein